MVLFPRFLMTFELAVRPGQYSPNTRRWWRPVASHEGLNPLYWAISAVLCQPMNLSVETGRTEVHSFDDDDFAIDQSQSY
jgi:hypothetical protein